MSRARFTYTYSVPVGEKVVQQMPAVPLSAFDQPAGEGPFDNLPFVGQLPEGGRVFWAPPENLTTGNFVVDYVTGTRWGDAALATVLSPKGGTLLNVVLLDILRFGDREHHAGLVAGFADAMTRHLRGKASAAH